MTEILSNAFDQVGSHFDRVALTCAVGAGYITLKYLKNVDLPMPPGLREAPLPVGKKGVKILQHLADRTGVVDLAMMQKYPGEAYGTRAVHLGTVINTYDPQDIEAVLVKETDVFQLGREYGPLKLLLGEQNLLNKPDAEHEVVRKLLNPSFAGKRMFELGNGPMLPHSGVMLAKFYSMIKANDNQPTNVHTGPLFNLTSFNIIGETAFKGNDSTLEVIRHDIENMMSFFPRLHIPLGCKIPDKAQQEFVAAQKRITAHCLKVVEASKMQFTDMTAADKNNYLGNAAAEKTLLDLLIINGEHVMSNNELADNSLVLLFGGYETSATTMCWFSVTLAHHPDVQEKLYEELVDVLQLGKIARFDDVKNLPYLDMFIKELTRWNSITHATLRFASKDTVLPGTKTFVPKGGTVACVRYLAHLNPLLWGEDAHLFKPERWEDPELLSRIEKNPGMYHPFSLGPRSCIGKDYALVSLKVLIAPIVRSFALSPKPGVTQYPAREAKLITHPEDDEVVITLREE